MRPNLIITQAPSAAESRAVATAAMLEDIALQRSPLERLPEFADALRSGALPVGSVEFVREAMRLAAIPEPGNISYPDALDSMLYRQVSQRDAGHVIGTWFVKPCTTKAFTGFVFDTMRAREDYPEHDREQYDAFMALPPETRVWTSEPVTFVSEWRYYVLGDDIFGAARYDPDGAEDAPAPDAHVVAAAVRSMSECPDSPAAYGLDVGVLSTGETALVEVNDAWALGLYGRGIEPREYLRMLAARWNQLRESPGEKHTDRPADPTGRLMR